MSTSLRLSDEVNAPIIDADQVEIIGKVGTRQYARDADGELLIGGRVEPWEVQNPVQPGEVWLQRREKYQTREMAFPETRQVRIRARRVPDGSYQQAVAAEQAKAAAAERRANRPFLPVDALAEVRALAPKMPQFQALSEAPENPLLKQSALKADGRPAIRGPRAILDHLAAKGIRLEVTPDGTGLLVRARAGRLDPQLREAIRATSRLLVGELSGDGPVRCELCSGTDRQPAVAIVEVDVAVCQRHATEEVQP